MIAQERLEQVRHIVERAGLQDQTVTELRRAFPEMHFTSCLEEDMGTEEPFMRADGFNVYLVDGRDHCMRFTADPATATGILLSLDDEQQ